MSNATHAAIFASMLTLYGLVASCSLAEDPPSPDTVIARVNGEEILYGDIYSKVPSGYTPDVVAKSGTTRPSNAQDKQLAWDTENLAAVILQVIRQQHGRRLGIVVTEADVDAYIEELKKESKKERIDGRSRMEIIVESLSEVYDDGRDPDAVFDERLSDWMPRSSWSASLQQFKDPELRQALAEEAAKTEFDEDDRDAIRRALHSLRLREEISKRLHARHPGRYDDFEKRVPIDSNNNDNVTEYVTVHLLERDIYLWWQSVIEHTAIEFPLPAYVGALAHVKQRYDLGEHPTPDLDEP